MQWPDTFKPLKKVEKLLQEKIKLLETENKIANRVNSLRAKSKKGTRRATRR